MTLQPPTTKVSKATSGEAHDTYRQPILPPVSTVRHISTPNNTDVASTKLRIQPVISAYIFL